MLCAPITSFICPSTWQCFCNHIQPTAIFARGDPRSGSPRAFSRGQKEIYFFTEGRAIKGHLMRKAENSDGLSHLHQCRIFLQHVNRYQRSYCDVIAGNRVYQRAYRRYSRCRVSRNRTLLRVLRCTLPLICGSPSFGYIPNLSSPPGSSARHSAYPAAPPCRVPWQVSCSNRGACEPAEYNRAPYPLRYASL